MSKSSALHTAKNSSLSGVRFSYHTHSISNSLNMDLWFNFCGGITKFKPLDKTPVSIGKS